MPYSGLDPVSGWSVVRVLLTDATHVAERGCNGRAETSRFQALSEGKTEHPPIVGRQFVNRSPSLAPNPADPVLQLAELLGDDLGIDRFGSLSRQSSEKGLSHSIEPRLVEDVKWGCVQQQGEQGVDVARNAVLIAGLPVEIGGETINRNCASSLCALNNAAMSIFSPRNWNV